jgi:hypothetical protein
MFSELADYLFFSIRSIPIVLLGWVHLAKSGSLFVFEFWNKKIPLDKVFFVLLFLQLALCNFSWFSYDVKFFDTPEVVYISPKWNFFFILISLLNFFFLGFWKSSWIRIWFFSTQLMMMIIILWGYLEPSRYFFDFINNKEIHYRFVFYGFAAVSSITFICGYVTFKDEDKRFDRV